MREIKVRAWMKPEYSQPNAGYDTFTIQELMSGKYDFNKYEHWGEYTGLKDKNGVEIYEGDIVKYQLGKYKDPDGGYGPDNWEMFYEVAEIAYDEDKGRFKRKDRFHDFIDTPECEVIGNIYENPELLKVPTHGE